ncbi:MAG: hypothetical protein KC900_07005 [Candidatus Omnitrophica bacterium]|nr:hypothetical protein [Candidatus Omnitrophota bacterium]
MHRCIPHSINHPARILLITLCALMLPQPKGAVLNPAVAAANSKEMEEQSFHPNGKLKAEWTTVDGRKQGDYKEYTENGQLRRHYLYADNEQHGLQIEYSPNGNIKREFDMYRGRLQGEEKTYYESGELNKVTTYKNNRRDGPALVYRKTGLLQRESNYKNGRLSGNRKDFWLNGQISTLAKYQNGKLHGEFKTFSPEGKLLKVSYYKNGKPLTNAPSSGQTDDIRAISEALSVQKEFYETGELKSIAQFRNGLFHGMLKRFFDSGATKSITHYYEGLRDGVQIVYYESGIVASQLFYKDDKLHGIQKFFYRNGVLRAKERYEDGIQSGVQEYYYENGVMLSRKFFRRGNLLRLQRFVYENGVLKTIEELIQNQEIVRNVEEAEEENVELLLSEYFLEADIQEFYDNGNIKLELETKESGAVFQRLYYEGGGLEYEIKWAKGDGKLYYEHYDSVGGLAKAELAGIYKHADLVRHKDFCDSLSGEMINGHCRLTTTDSNNDCIDSEQCQAMCITRGKNEGDEAQGKCSPYSDMSDGCYNFISQGIASAPQGKCGSS